MLLLSVTILVSSCVIGFSIYSGAAEASEVQFLRERLVYTDSERAALLERLDALRVPVTAPIVPEAQTAWLSEQGEIDANESLRRERLLMENQ